MAALVGGPRQAARLEVIRATEDTGWFQAPRNVAFTMIGWLYGDGDFGKSICPAVNCGDDTDCTGATMGSILGIIGGTKTIPAKRRDPIGEKNVTVAVAGFPGPKDLNKLTDRTLAMTKKVLAMNNAPIAITSGFSHKSGAKALLDSAPAAVRPLWNKSPYQIVWHEPDLQVTLDYLTDPVIQPKVQRSLQVTVHNQGDAAKSVRVGLKDVPKGWQVTGLPSEAISLAGHAAKTLDWALAAAGRQSLGPGASVCEDPAFSHGYASGGVEASRNFLRLTSPGNESLIDLVCGGRRWLDARLQIAPPPRRQLAQAGVCQLLNGRLRRDTLSRPQLSDTER